ncbi:GNAT family N-acetyltransferase [Patulibacter sp. NPDC049589]|uniref:GNAT family N-acetyltransferase n=1 Tax=Patulibacter sp. NPDC049589 TaxID=3154731 RepID=UPI003434E8B9
MPGASAQPRHLEPLREHHAIDSFSCGVAPLDSWLRRSAATVAAKHVGRTYVWVAPSAPDVVLGYVTLAPHVVRRVEAPGRIARGSPETIPAILLARLALSQDLHGNGHGADLLVDALHRALDAIVIAGGRLMVVDAIDDRAAAFYEHFGFARLPGSQRLFRKATDIARDLGRDSTTLEHEAS